MSVGRTTVLLKYVKVLIWHHKVRRHRNEHYQGNRSCKKDGSEWPDLNREGGVSRRLERKSQSDLSLDSGYSGVRLESVLRMVELYNCQREKQRIRFLILKELSF